MTGNGNAGHRHEPVEHDVAMGKIVHKRRIWHQIMTDQPNRSRLNAERSMAQGKASVADCTHPQNCRLLQVSNFIVGQSHAERPFLAGSVRSIMGNLVGQSTFDVKMLPIELD